MKIDLANASGGLLPEGEHVARIADATDAVSKKGNDMIVLDWVVSGGQHKGAEVRDWIVPQVFPDKFVDLCQSVGIPIPMEAFDFEVEKLIGQRARIVVFHDEWEGNKRPKISGYKELDPADPDDPLAVSPAAAASADTDIPF